MVDQELAEIAPSGEATSRVVALTQEVLAEACAKPLPSALYLVSTPIGNLTDISLRALSVLARADLIACEDTRHSRKLLDHYGIKAPLMSYHEHNAASARPKLLAKLAAGGRVALISDAGTPLISDPGYRLVREAAEAGLDVTAIPGASASLAGLSLSGLPTDSFFFAGFLPPKSAARRTRIEELARVPGTLIFYETAPRLIACLRDLAEVLGVREAAVAKELTKLHESVWRGTLGRLAEDLAGAEPPRGEYVVLVGPPAASDREATDEEIVAALRKTTAEMSTRDAVKAVTEAFGAKRARVYRLSLALSDRED